MKEQEPERPKPTTYHLTQVLPRCPDCKSTKLSPYSYKRHKAEGITTKYCKCRDCGTNVNIDVS